MTHRDSQRRALAVTPEWDWLLRRGPHGLKFDWGDHRWFGSHLQVLRNAIGNEVSADPAFEAKLRAAAVEALELDGVEFLRRAIQVLSVIGLAEDQPSVSPFLQHPDEGVSKDARSCLFELKRRWR